MKASTRKCQTAIERDHILYFFLTQFYPKNVMRQPPCSIIILIIKGAADHSCLNNLSWMIKIKKHCYNFFTPNRMIFQLDGFQPHHPLVNLTTHMLIYIYIYTVDCLFVMSSFHHCCCHSFFNLWFKRGSSCVLWVFSKP